MVENETIVVLSVPRLFSVLVRFRGLRLFVERENSIFRLDRLRLHEKGIEKRETELSSYIIQVETQILLANYNKFETNHLQSHSNRN